MKTLLLVFLGMAAGWFWCVAEQFRYQKIYSPLRPSLVALLALAIAAAVALHAHD